MKENWATNEEFHVHIIMYHSIEIFSSFYFMHSFMLIDWCSIIQAIPSIFHANSKLQFDKLVLF